MTSLDNAPGHWTKTTIGEVADVRLGRQRSPKDHSGDQMRPYLRAANVDWYRLRPDDVLQMNFTDDAMETYALREGDILIVEGSGSATEVGKCALVLERFAGHAFQNTLIRVRAGDAVDANWLMHRINAEAELGGFLALARGSGIFHLGSRRTGQWPIALPPLEEQRAITARLDSMLSRVERPLPMLRDISTRRVVVEKSRIAQVLGQLDWSARVSWGEVGFTLNGKAFPSKDYGASGVKLVRPGNLAADGSVTWDVAATRYLPTEHAEDNPRHLLTGEVLLMNLTAQSLADDFLGRVCVSSADDRFLLNQRIAALSSDRAAIDYLFWVFRSPAFRGFISSKNAGSTIQHVSTKRLEDFVFPLPSIEVQRRVAETMRSFRAATTRLDATAQITLKRAHRLRQSILKAAFEGRLTRGLQEAASPTELHDRLAS